MRFTASRRSALASQMSAQSSNTYANDAAVIYLCFPLAVVSLTRTAAVLAVAQANIPFKSVEECQNTKLLASLSIRAVSTLVQGLGWLSVRFRLPCVLVSIVRATQQDLKKLNKNKKMVKKLADSFDAFLASQVGSP